MKTVITAENDSLVEYLANAWKHRNLVLTLAKRDIKIKYAQTAIGVGWSVIQPLTAVIVFTLFFGVILDMETADPYPLYVLSGIACWNLFNYIFSQGSTSLMNSQDLIRKLSFPKIVLPASKVLVGLVEFGVVMLLLIPLFIWYGTPVLPNLVLLPVVVFFLCVFALGASLVLAGATLRNRDLHHITPFLVNFGIWFTPVFYPISLIPDAYADFLYLNPMASLIEVFRWTLFGGEVNLFAALGVLISVIFLVLGVIYFRYVEDQIADKV